MTVTAQLEQKITIGGETLAFSKQYTDTASISLEPETVVDPATDTLVALTLDVSAITALYMVSDADLTVETNSAGTPTDTFNLKKNVPVVWNSDLDAANPFTADVTALYLTTLGTNANFKLRVLYDSTI